jgi:hypothetical protein
VFGNCSRLQQRSKWKAPPRASVQNASGLKCHPATAQIPLLLQPQGHGDGVGAVASVVKSRLGPHHDARHTIEAR